LFCSLCYSDQPGPLLASFIIEDEAWAYDGSRHRRLCLPGCLMFKAHWSFLCGTLPHALYTISETSALFLQKSRKTKRISGSPGSRLDSQSFYGIPALTQSAQPLLGSAG